MPHEKGISDIVQTNKDNFPRNWISHEILDTSYPISPKIDNENYRIRGKIGYPI